MKFPALTFLLRFPDPGDRYPEPSASSLVGEWTTTILSVGQIRERPTPHLHEVGCLLETFRSSFLLTGPGLPKSDIVKVGVL